MTRRPRRLPLHPARLIAGTFAAAIVVGTALLSLPIAHAPGQDVSVLAALFTAVSATCVTGLVVIDPASSFTLFGELVILVLIQLGGLGLLTFGTVFAVFRGRKVSFEQRFNTAQQASVLDLGDVTRLIKGIFLFTLLSELVGALLLYPRFAQLEGPLAGAYYALFHSVSAFNNAGFALYPDNVIRFADDPWVLGVLASLLVLGGLGYLVLLSAVLQLRYPRRHRAGLNTKLSLVTYGALAALGVLVVLALEWNNPRTLGALDGLGRLTSGLFQGLSPRTAGFNSVDFAGLMPGTLFFMMLLMLVGGNPGSTAGGIKTTTFAVLVASTLSLVRGREDTNVFERRIEREYLLRAGVVAVLSLLFIGIGLFVLTVTNPRVPFLNLAFEAFSAFGTAGLSMNTTPVVSASGQIVLMLLMFLGRVGPLTFALAFGRSKDLHEVRYVPDRSIVIG